MSYTELDHPKDKEPGGVKAYHRLNESLDALYGKNPIAVEVYLRLYPGRMK